MALRALLSGALAVGVGVLAGCETESAGKAEITVNPPSATVSRGQSVEFVASGWHDYTWELTNGDWGVLSRLTGDRTIYTSLYSPDSDATNGSSGRAIQILKAKGVGRMQTTTTNEPVSTATVPLREVIITHI
jgi:hypothetical protein